MESEITEEKEMEPSCNINSEDQKNSIRRIIDHQKSLYYSTSSSTSASCSSSFASSRKSNALIDLMTAGNTSLRRLFDMEHTSLANYLQDYSNSPIIKPILLWGSDSDEDEKHHDDPWLLYKSSGANVVDPGNYSHSDMASENSFVDGNGVSIQPERKSRIRKQKLNRTKSFRRLPGFSVWRCGGFRFRLRLKRLRVVFRCRNL